MSVVAVSVIGPSGMRGFGPAASRGGLARRARGVLAAHAPVQCHGELGVHHRAGQWAELGRFGRVAAGILVAVGFEDTHEEFGERVRVFADPAAGRQHRGERHPFPYQLRRDLQQAAADVDDLVTVGGQIAQVEGGGQVLRGDLALEVVRELFGVRRTGVSSLGSPRPSTSATSRPLSKVRARSAMPVRVCPRSSRPAMVRSRARW